MKLRLRSLLFPSHPIGDWFPSFYTLRRPRRHGLRKRWTNNARYELRVAPSLPTRQRRLLFLLLRLRPHVAKPLLFLLFRVAQGHMTSGRCHFRPAHRNGIYGLRSTMGANEFLGGYSYYQSIFSHPLLRQRGCELTLGRYFCWYVHFNEILQSPLHIAFRYSCPCSASHNIPTRQWRK